MIRTMIVDDMQYICLGYKLMFNKNTDIEMIAQAGNGQESVDVIAKLEEDSLPLPDVILMDVRMPVMDGIEATRRITRFWPAIKVLILTTFDEDDYAYGGLAAGASGFLLKDSSVEILVNAIRAVADGDAVVTPRITRQILERGISETIQSESQINLQRQFHELPPRQYEICSLIAQGLTNQEIADSLVIEATSVRRMVSRILAKLNLHDRTQIAVAWYKANMFR